jgi:hypothetical protein
MLMLMLMATGPSLIPRAFLLYIRFSSSQHDPQSQHEHRYLHGAACHGCVLLAETSCEQRNDFLDRALVVPTVEHTGIHCFPRPLT